ncbi:MAG: dethiobiotin synthase [Planctomycetes bacterium]|nr:dethiobiotin synthase [Planctomycetota bacterium]
MEILQNESNKRVSIMIPPGLFITGTGTDVGKTYVTSLIARELVSDGVTVGAYKPVCSGCEERPNGDLIWRDIEELSKAIGGGFDPERICPQRFSAGLAPPVAARMEGKTVDATLLRRGAAWWNDKVDFLLIEGVGGLLCPLTDEESVADLAKDLEFPLLIVASLGLGTINHTLLTVEVAQNRGIVVAGIVLNTPCAEEADQAAETNPREIAARCNVPVLGTVLHNQTAGLFRDGNQIKIDWKAIARL